MRGAVFLCAALVTWGAASPAQGAKPGAPTKPAAGAPAARPTTPRATPPRAPAPARAPTPAQAPTPDERADEGLRLFDRGEYVAAARAFLDAYEASKDERYLWNLTLAEAKAGLTFEALRHGKLYLVEGKNPQNLERAALLLERLRLDVARVQVRTDAGAEVWVDGQLAGQAPLAEAIDAQPALPHTVEARLGPRSARKELPAPGRGLVVVDLPLPPPPVAAPQPAVALDRGPSTLETVRTVSVVGALTGAAFGAAFGIPYLVEGASGGQPAEALGIAAGAALGLELLSVSALLTTLVLPEGDSGRSAPRVGAPSTTVRPRAGGAVVQAVWQF